jgi:hypothetical protein
MSLTTKADSIASHSYLLRGGPCCNRNDRIPNAACEGSGLYVDWSTTPNPDYTGNQARLVEDFPIIRPDGYCLNTLGNGRTCCRDIKSKLAAVGSGRSGRVPTGDF